MKTALWLSVTSLLLSSLTTQLHSMEFDDVLLVNETSDCIGTLWKRPRDGHWAAVKDNYDDFKMAEAHKVCRRLDCGSAASIKRVKVRQWVTNVQVICSESVRLVNGTGSCSGRVEVKSNQSWVSVCEGNFDHQDAEVVCRQLGCVTHPILLGALYGEATVPMWTNEFQCEGNESVLLDCVNTTRNTCSPDKAVGLTCSGVRLVEGKEGRCIGKLQEKPDGEWKTMITRQSDDIWRLMETHPVCRQLDCGSVSTTTGSGGLPGFWFPKSYDDMEVFCSDVRLVGGASPCAGILERRLEGEWRAVHADHYDYKFELKTAHEVCRHLDCGTAASTTTIRPDGGGSKVEVICSGSVRLVNGNSWCSGRVEVKSNQSWVSVCEGDFDRHDAEVACEQLGCGPPSVLQGALYGEASVPMWTKAFRCHGNESALLDCGTSNSTRNTCSPDEAVGLTCSDFRLVEREGKCIGKLTERHDAGWKRIYDDRTWTLMKEKQLCRQLDCGLAASGIFYTADRGRVQFICSDVRLVGGTSDCNGTLEKKTDDGEWVQVRDFEHAVDMRAAHKVCRQLDCGNAALVLNDAEYLFDPKTTKITCSGSVRLVNGSSEYSGRVEVRSDQSWVSVCEGDFDQKEAEVVCRQLGGGTHAILQRALHGEASAPMWTKEFQCHGNESALLDCGTSNSTRNTCSPVGLICSEFRLVGGASNCDGVLEMQLWGEWRPTFERYRDWGMGDSHVLCRQLGCGHALHTARRAGSERRTVWHTLSNCKGQESTAKDCIWKEWDYSGHAYDSREITCSGPPVQPTPNTRS